MKVFIAVLCLVGTTSIQEDIQIIFEFTEVERYWTVCPTNKVFFTRNQSETTQNIELKQTIDPQHQLFASVEITHKDSGEIIFRGESLKICIEDEDAWGKSNLQSFAVRFFKVTMLPQDSWHKCPIKAEKYQIYRFTDDWIVILENKIPEGHYEIAYTIKSADGEGVFSPLKFKFLSRDVTPAPGCC